MPLRIVLLLLIALLLAPLSPASARDADQIDEAAAERVVATLLEKDLASDLQAIWRLSDSFVACGKPAIRALRGAIEGATPTKRLAIGRALLLLMDYTKGLEVLRELVAAEAPVADLKKAALRLVGRDGELEEAEWLEDRIDVTFDPAVKMAMAKALWQLNFSNKRRGKQVLLAYLRSTDEDLRAEGALALGEIGAADEARPILRQLRGEPTERGRSAEFLLRLLSSEAAAERGLRAEGDLDNPPPLDPGPVIDMPPPGRWPLLDEIFEKLERSYVDRDEVERKKIEDAMAAGITKALDPFTAYLSPEDHAKLREGLDPTYGGVGAYVFNDSNNQDRFTISRPIWGGPLYRQGLRTGDIVTAIEGRSTDGLTTDECVRMLKGPPGTEVTITVFRPGWTEARSFTLTRARITIPTVTYDVLPGKIGFLEVLSFSQDTALEVGKVLDRFDQMGIRGLIVDLRYNGGGYLQSAVENASHFLPAGTLVVSERGRNGESKERPHLSVGLGDARRQVPTVVLINQGTASAAEILSGALQIHGRARLIGTMSFGKGSVQNPLDLRTRPGEEYEDAPRDFPTTYTDENGNGRHDPGEPVRHRFLRNGRYDPPEKFVDANGNARHDAGESFTDANMNERWDAGEKFKDANGNGIWDPGAVLKLTVGAYYLPDGRNLKRKTEIVDGEIVTKGGLVPDVEAEPDPPDYWKVQAQRALDGSTELRTYVDRLFETERELIERLARSDQKDPSLYPGFDEFYESLDTPLDKDPVRALVRWNLRRRISDELGRQLSGDIVDDPVLQKAIIDLFASSGRDLGLEKDLVFLKDVAAKDAAAKDANAKDGADAKKGD